MMLKILPIIAVLFIVSACSTLQKELNNYVAQPKVSYKSISVGEVSLERLQLLPIFNVANDNDFPIPVNALNYQLSLNNSKVLAGEMNEIGTLAANSGKDITLPIELTQETLSALQQILFKDKQLNYQIKGDVDAMGVSVPFDKSATLYLPTIKINDLNVKSASFDLIDLMISIDVENKNEFSLPLEEVSYSLSTQGRALFEGSLTNKELGQGTQNIQIPLTVKPKDLFSSIFSMLLNPELPLHVEIKGPLINKSYDHSLNLSDFFSN